MRRAVDVPNFPRKPWVTPELSRRLEAHASARRHVLASGRARHLARLRLAFVAGTYGRHGRLIGLCVISIIMRHGRVNMQ